jgi:hypothetical protein
MLPLIPFKPFIYQQVPLQTNRLISLFLIRQEERPVSVQSQRQVWRGLPGVFFRPEAFTRAGGGKA